MLWRRKKVNKRACLVDTIKSCVDSKPLLLFGKEKDRLPVFRKAAVISAGRCSEEVDGSYVSSGEAMTGYPL